MIDDLGPFDLDPCAAINQPWSTAKTHFTIEDNGLLKGWFGLVWMNPPYGPETGKWLQRLSDHGNGIALIFARTETRDFFQYVWNKANALLFIRSRIYFHNVNGTQASANAGAPSVLIGYGNEAVARLEDTKIGGYFLGLR